MTAARFLSRSRRRVATLWRIAPPGVHAMRCLVLLALVAFTGAYAPRSVARPSRTPTSSSATPPSTTAPASRSSRRRPHQGRQDRRRREGREDRGRDRVIDATGLVDLPRLHRPAHALRLRPAPARPAAANLNYVTQGCTTVVTGNCGSGPVDVGEFFKKLEERRRRHERHSPGAAQQHPRRR